MVLKKIFKVGQCILAISLLSPLANCQGPSFAQTWIPITLECFVLSLVEIGPVFFENTIFKNRQCIFAISLLSLLGNGRGLSFQETWIPITKGYFVHSLVEIGPVVLKKKFKVRQCIFAISSLSPLGKGRGPSFEQTWIPFTKGCFVPSLVEIDQVDLEKNIFIGDISFFKLRYKNSEDKNKISF